MKNKALITLIGFLLFITGTLALCLSLVGLRLGFLQFIDLPGPMFGFIARLVMIFGGVVLIVLARTDWRQQEE